MIKSNEYVLVEWPKCQDYMEEDWFEDEAYYGPESSYFIPKKRIINYDNNYIETEILNLALDYECSDNNLNCLESEWESSFPFEGGMSLSESIINIKMMYYDERNT